jgi:hypothetical protein
MDIMKLLLLNSVDKEFEGDALEPSDMPRLRAPVAPESPGVPSAVGRDANTPRGRGVYEEVEVDDGAARDQGTSNAWLGKLFEPPTQLGEDGGRGPAFGVSVVAEVGYER